MGEYVVIGLGRFGSNLAKELHSMGNEVMGVDTSRHAVQEMSGVIRQAIEADATSEAALNEIGVADVSTVVVAISDPEPSIMATLLLKKVGVRHVIAKATSDLHEEILRLVGADRVVFPEKETAVRLAHGVAVPQIVDYLSVTPEMGISKLVAPAQLVGRTYAEADLEQRFRIRMVAVVRKDRVIFGAPIGEKFQPNDVLLVSGRDEDLHALSRFIEEETTAG